MDESDNSRSVTLMRGYEREQDVSRRATGRGMFRRASDLIPAGDAHAVEAGSQRSLCNKLMLRIEGLWPPGTMERGCPTCLELADGYGQRQDA